MTKDEFNQVKMDKIVVLQNENTASAAEVLIGALKDNLGDTVKVPNKLQYHSQMEQVLSIQWHVGIRQKVQVSTRRVLNQMLK